MAAALRGRQCIPKTGRVAPNAEPVPRFCRFLLRSPRHARTFCIHGYCANVADETANQRRWRLDADTLHEVGAHIVSSGVPTVEIRLPANSLAEPRKPGSATTSRMTHLTGRAQNRPRYANKAATLALIGLAITESGARRSRGRRETLRCLGWRAEAAADDS